MRAHGWSGAPNAVARSIMPPAVKEQTNKLQTNCSMFWSLVFLVFIKLVSETNAERCVTYLPSILPHICLTSYDSPDIVIQSPEEKKKR